MSDVKLPKDFPDLSVEDTISLTLGPGSAGVVEFTLEAAPSVTWWKGVEVRSRTGSMIDGVQTQDANHGPNGFSVAVTDLVGARLTLAKAKGWGIHTGMYELRDLPSFAGQKFDFIWQRDDHKDGAVLGFFRDLGNGIVAVTDAAANVVETVVETVAEVVSTVTEGIGTAVSDALNAVSNLVGGIPGIGGFLRGAFHWLATVVSAVSDFQASVLRGFLDLVANVSAGVIRITGGVVAGFMAWDARLLAKGAGDVAAGVAGAFIAAVGTFVALVQALLFAQLGERQLTDTERDMLRRVYRGSIELYNVRIVDGKAGIFSTNSRAFTLGNTIYMKQTSKVDYEDVLVHECCHVWQYQHVGTRYIADALWAQARVPDTYNWRLEIGRGRLRWEDFNREAQASFFQDLFISGVKVPPPPKKVQGEFYDDDPLGPLVEFIVGATSYTSIAREAVAHVRGASWPIARAG